MRNKRVDAPKVAQAEARSTAYALIAAGFRYPDKEGLEDLRDRMHWDRWQHGLAVLDGTAATALEGIRRCMSDPSERCDVALIQENYATLFGHAVRGTCPLYELEYGKSEIIQRASELADIAGFYAAFGLHLTGDAAERVDHLSVEAEFMGVLAGKEAYGMRTGDPALVESCCDGQRKFLRAHLGRWIPAVARRIREADPDGFYGRVAAFAAGFVLGECARMGVEAGSRYMALRPADPTQETSQSCGVPDAGDGTTGEPVVQLSVPCP